jgi:hypothetical protein
VHKIYVVATVPVFRALLPAFSRNSGFQVHLQIQKVVTLSHQNQAAGHVSLGKGQDSLPGWNVKSQTEPLNCCN